MIDLHCHILPGIDDGPETLEGSLELARRALGEGIATTAATPHVNARFQLSEAELDALPGRVADLNSALERAELPLSVVRGAEVALSRLDAVEGERLAALCLGAGPYLLVESPYAPVIPFLDEALFGLQTKGIKPLLAHPERCPLFQREPDRLTRLVDRGVLCSVNAGSIAGDFGRTVRRFSLDLLRDGLVHVVATDAHDHERRAPQLLPGLASAFEELPGLPEEVERLTEEAPAAILSGAAVPRAPALEPRPRSLLQRLLGRD